MRTNAFLPIILLLIPFGPGLHAQGPDTISTVRLDNRQNILNGRAWLRLPAKAMNEQRARDIMAADPSANRETRIVYDVGTKRLVLFAQELFLKGSENLIADLESTDPDTFFS